MKSLFPTTSASFRSKYQQRYQHYIVIITFTLYYCIVMTLSRVALSRAFVFPTSMKRALPSTAIIGDGYNTATASNKKRAMLMDAANDLATSASTTTATEVGNNNEAAAAAPQPPLYLAEGIFAVHKPLTWTCNDVVSYIRNILTRDALSRGVKKERKKRGKPMMKVGHGGTLDPLASGVLVVGIGKGTSKLQSYLEGDKQYTALVELGYETTTLDAEGEIIKTANWDHVSSIESIRETCIPKFTGQIQQVPPLYSAIRVDGKRLYEIARDNDAKDDAKAAAVDVEIPTRDVHVYSLEVESSVNESVLQSGVVDGRKYKEAVKQMEEAAVAAAAATTALEAERTANSSSPLEAETQESDDNEATSVGKGKNKKRKRDKKNKKKSEKKNLFDESTIPTIQRAQDDATTTSTSFDLPLFTLNVSCGGGTYIRSLVRDIGYEMDTVATMTGLVRTKQGPFLLQDVLKREDWNAEKIYEAVTKNKVV